jgi:hypothetical protein
MLFLLHIPAPLTPCQDQTIPWIFLFVHTHNQQLNKPSSPQSSVVQLPVSSNVNLHDELVCKKCPSEEIRMSLYCRRIMCNSICQLYCSRLQFHSLFFQTDTKTHVRILKARQSISNKTIERVSWKNPIAPTTHFETLTLTKTLHPNPKPQT